MRLCLSLQLKPGGPISEKGKKITLHVENIKDLSRDVIKVQLSSLYLIELLASSLFSNLFSFSVNF